MNENAHPNIAFIRKILIPLLVAFALVIATVMISGSVINSIGDAQINRVLAGTYGTPDWRVQEMNPLLAQILTLFYGIIPAINWYGVLLLVLLALAAATAIGIAARKPGGLIPAAIAISPLVIFCTYAVQSSVVCALAAAAGAVSLMDGIQRRKKGAWRAVLGAVLYCFAAMLSIRWALIAGIGIALGWLPRSFREERLRGLLLGLPAIAVILAALFGYSSLMYASPELSGYRQNYALYESVLHSSLADEETRLLETYGFSEYSGEHDDHDHDEEGDDHDHEDEGTTEVEPNVFDTVDWSLNDASLFFSRFSADARLTDPDALRVLNDNASHFDFDLTRLLKGLVETARKPQFLLVIGLFVASAIVVLVTTRGRGIVTLLAALMAIGGHVFTLLSYYDTFEAIAPFYLLAIMVLLFHFDGESANAWLKRAVSSRGARAAVRVALSFLSIAAIGGIFYLTAQTPINSGVYTMEAVNFLTPYIETHKDTLFIGDNPHERVRPETLKAPVRGADENLLAGSYDLYSPRAAAMMQRYGIENPLLDCLDREDIAYVTMSFLEPIAFRYIEAYDKYLDAPKELLTVEELKEMIIGIVALPEETVEEQKAAIDESIEQAELWVQFFQEAEEKGLLPAAEDAEAEETEQPTATEAPTRAPTAAPTATATAATATATPRPTATAAGGTNASPTVKPTP